MADAELDAAQRLQSVQNRRNDLGTRRARLTIRGEQALEERKRLEAEMLAAKTSPETLDKDLELARQTESAALTTCEQELDLYEKDLKAAEVSLEPKVGTP